MTDANTRAPAQAPAALAAELLDRVDQVVAEWVDDFEAARPRDHLELPLGNKLRDSIAALLHAHGTAQRAAGVEAERERWRASLRTFVSQFGANPALDWVLSDMTEINAMADGESL